MTTIHSFQPRLLRRPRDTAAEVDGINILHVEDRAQDRFLVKKLLEKQAPAQQMLKIIEADTLLDGIDILRTTDRAIHCILLDLNLPDARGLEVLLRIKNINRQIPIIIVTGLEDPATLEAAVRFGAHSYVQKKDVARFANIWQPIFDAILSGPGPATAQYRGPQRECIFTLDSQHRIASWDDSCALLTGWPAAEVRSKPLEKLTVKGFRKDMLRALLEPEAHIDQDIEFDLVDPSGKVVRLELSAVSNDSAAEQNQQWRLRQPADEVINAIASQIVNAVVRLSGEMLLIVDIDGRIHRCSDTTETLLGDPARDVVGITIQELTDASSAKDARDMLLSTRRGLAFSAERYSLATHNQGTLEVRLHATPLRDEFGGLIGACVIGHPLGPR